MERCNVCERDIHSKSFAKRIWTDERLPKTGEVWYLYDNCLNNRIREPIG